MLNYNCYYLKVTNPIICVILQELPSCYTLVIQCLLKNQKNQQDEVLVLSVAKKGSNISCVLYQMCEFMTALGQSNIFDNPMLTFPGADSCVCQTQLSLFMEPKYRVWSKCTNCCWASQWVLKVSPLLR